MPECLPSCTKCRDFDGVSSSINFSSQHGDYFYPNSASDKV